jgi:hypothetical protein
MFSNNINTRNPTQKPTRTGDNYERVSNKSSLNILIFSPPLEGKDIVLAARQSRSLEGIALK